MERRKAAAVAVAIGAFVSPLAPTPASAAGQYSYCQISSWSCTSGSIPANSSSHSVQYRVNAAYGRRCYYTVRDTGNGVAVASGSTTTLVGWTTIPGLYGYYRIELSSGGSEQAIDCYGFVAQ